MEEEEAQRPEMAQIDRSQNTRLPDSRALVPPPRAIVRPQAAATGHSRHHFYVSKVPMHKLKQYKINSYQD